MTDEIDSTDEDPAGLPVHSDADPATHSRRTAVIAGAVVLLLVCATALFLVLRPGGLPSDAVFRLDGRTYVHDDLEQFLRQQQALYGTEPPDLSQDTPRRAAAQSYAVSLIVDQAAEEAGVSVSDAEVAAAESDFIDRSYPAGRDAFIEALAAEGVSEQDVVDELRRQLLVSALYDEVTKDVSVETATVVDTYRSNPDEFVQQETRLVSEIVLPSCGVARSVAPRLTDARAFARVARTRSLDSTTATKGGSLGFVARDQLQAAFGAAAFAARVGETFGPVRAEGGDYCYLGMVLEVRPERALGFEEVRVALTRELGAARGLERWKSYLEDQIRDADVEYADRYRPADPDAVPGAELPTASPSTAPSPRTSTGP